ncbi:hypothetical protein ACHAWX_005366 [Stephanocyclus meneghinianus]
MSQAQHPPQQPLLTPTSVSLSLAPPRSPPTESWIHDLHRHCFRDVLRWNQDEIGRLLSKTDAHRDTDDVMLRSHQLLSRVLHTAVRREERTRAWRNRNGRGDECRCGSCHRHYHHHYHQHRTLLPNQLTRFIGSILPLHWQHHFRDSGKFRWVADGLVKLTCPLIAVGRWKEIRQFIDLSRPPIEITSSTSSHSSSLDGNDPLETNAHDTADHTNNSEKKKKKKKKTRWRRQRIRYGEHDMQYIDLYWPNMKLGNTNDPHPANHDTSTDCKDTKTDPTAVIIKGTVFFVHGGAWGSGRPWMYRLVAPIFLEYGFVVAIVGYRTYPDARVVTHDLDGGAGSDSQLCDVNSAWGALQTVMGQIRDVYKDCDGWVGNVLMGHSSGAHVALLMLVDMIGERLQDNADREIKRLYPDLFIGLSGPYDISDHFHFEAGRGVEQISPMKAICGGTRDNFSIASPVSRLMKQISTGSHARTVQECTPPLLFLHGMEDTTVPFTATADAARALRSCGVVDCEEVYLEKCGHQDVVMHFMIGGAARDETMEYLLSRGGKKRETNLGHQRMQVKSRL